MTRNGRNLSVIGLAALLALGPAAVATGQDTTDPATAARTYWQHDPAAAGRWFDPANWSAGVPDAVTTAHVTNGGTAVIWDSTLGPAAAAALHVDRGAVQQTGGALTVRQNLRVGAAVYWIQEPVTTPDGQIADSLYPYPRPYPNGTYELQGGDLATGRTEVGLTGMGQFTQSGGVHKTGSLRIGGHAYWPIYRADEVTDPATGEVFLPPILWPPTNRGTYTLGGGRLEAGSVRVGSDSPYDWLRNAPETSDGTSGSWLPYAPGALFVQTGGHAVVTGTVMVQRGRYEMRDGTLTAGNLNLMTGNYAYSYLQGSQFHQSGGRVQVRGQVIVGMPFPTMGFAPVYGVQTLTLSGGRLEAGDVLVGGGTRSTLTQTGGELVVRGALRISYAGRLTLGGEAKVAVHGRWVLGGGARYTAWRHARVRMNGADFQNYGTDPDALAGLGRTAMVFSIGPEDDLEFETFEVAGKDRGFSRWGWYRNFQLGTLQVGGEDVGEVKLVDEMDNQPDWDGAEALYVHYLIVGPGSTLDLNGLDIYFLRGRIHEDATILRGRASQLTPLELDLPGDATFDGRVDGADLSLVAENWLRRDPDAWIAGDVTGDGFVDGADLSLIARHWLTGGGPKGAAVPEPAALLLLAGGAAAVLARRRR